MNNQLRYYIRMDQRGMLVSGSGIWRLKKPSTGRWKEVEGDVCCSPFTALTDTPADVSITDITVTIACDATTVLTVVAPGTSTDIITLVAILNTNLSYLGSFSENGTVVTLNLIQDIANTLCTGTLTMTVTGT